MNHEPTRADSSVTDRTGADSSVTHRNVAEEFRRLRAADDATDLGFTHGLYESVDRFAAEFDALWESDPVFRERWRPREGVLRRIFSGRHLDRRLKEAAARAGVRIDRQLSEHGGHWDFIGSTRYKESKGGRSLKLRAVADPGSARRCAPAVGTKDASYRRGEGTYSVVELIISPDGQLLMLERDVTGGLRHLWAYYVDGFANRRAGEDERVTSPDIMDARMYRDDDGTWRHRTGPVRVHRTWLRTGDTAAWRATAPWLDGDPESGVVVVPEPGPPEPAPDPDAGPD